MTFQAGTLWCWSKSLLLILGWMRIELQSISFLCFTQMDNVLWSNFSLLLSQGSEFREKMLDDLVQVCMRLETKMYCSARSCLVVCVCKTQLCLPDQMYVHHLLRLTRGQGGAQPHPGKPRLRTQEEHEW